jgi:hypothetical protein
MYCVLVLVELCAQTSASSCRISYLIASVVAAIGVTALGPTPASASSVSLRQVEAIQRGWSYVPEYSSAAPALALGEVVGSDGSALPGATVILFPVVKNSKAGTVMEPLARTITDTRGHFTLRLPTSRESRLASPKTRALNLHVIAFYAGGIAQWFYSLPTATSSPVPAKLVFHRSTVKAPNITGITVQPYSCEAVGAATQTGGIPATMGVKESAAGDLANTTFQYGSTATSTFGAGVSYTNSDSGFSADGSTTQITGGSQSWNKLPSASNNDLNGTAHYYDQEYDCQIAGNFSQYWTLTFHVVSGTASTPGITPIPTGKCSAYARNSTETETTGTQMTFSTGVKLTQLGFGVDLSSQDGFSTSSSLSYTTGPLHGHPICGQYDYPNAPDNIGVLAVHSTNIG